MPWDGPRRRIDAGFLTGLIVERPPALVYVAGPPAMVEGVRDALTEAGIDDDAIRSDDFFGY
jgi:ferredoxin-NADP reductase